MYLLLLPIAYLIFTEKRQEGKNQKVPAIVSVTTGEMSVEMSHLVTGLGATEIASVMTAKMIVMIDGDQEGHQGMVGGTIETVGMARLLQEEAGETGKVGVIEGLITVTSDWIKMR